jgi:hypothetical protein
MRAEEFYATAENGVIQVPEEYKNKKRFRVLVVEDLRFKREKTAAGNKSDLLLPPTMNTKGWKFDRGAGH